MRLSGLFLAPALLLAACSQANSPTGGARVVVLYPSDPDIMLTGTTDASAKVACTPAEPEHVVELVQPATAHVTLRGSAGAGQLEGAMLRVTQLATKQTWCAQMKDDDPVTLTPPEELPKGLYAVAVSATGQERYEILFAQD